MAVLIRCWGDALYLSKLLASPDLSGSLFIGFGSSAGEPRFPEWTLIGEVFMQMSLTRGQATASNVEGSKRLKIADLERSMSLITLMLETWSGNSI